MEQDLKHGAGLDMDEASPLRLGAQDTQHDPGEDVNMEDYGAKLQADAGVLSQAG